MTFGQTRICDANACKTHLFEAPKLGLCPCADFYQRFLYWLALPFQPIKYVHALPFQPIKYVQAQGNVAFAQRCND